MIRIAVVEDDGESAAILLQFLEQYQNERSCELKTDTYQDGETLVRGYRPEYDIILMDVQMEHLDGMTAAEIIRRQDPEVILIFITNMPQYAIRGYAVEALDYVLKPVSYFAFSQRMDRALSRIDRNRTHYIVLPVKGGSQKVDVAQIRYVESRGHSLLFHMRQGEIVSSGTMTEMERELEPYGFCRCNKGYLLNLDEVDAIQDGCAVVGADKLLISRGRKTAFMEALTNRMGGRTK
ncbi:MAG: LytTR family DNA-binding domain-containing protein [Clostridiales bacterium]|nr:LytTR family DNA-binding domain-containing protein [Clostridiales bacterium]